MPHDVPHDVIVIGGGHNGLTTAACLAQRGRRVLVLEANARLGGLASSMEFHPGYKAPGILHDTRLVPESIIQHLKLEEFGLRLHDKEIPCYAPEGQGRALGGRGRGLKLFRDPERSLEEISSFSSRDAERYREWRSFLDKITPFIRELLVGPAPDILAEGWAQLWPLLKKGVALRRLGEREMMELLRIAPMCVADWLNEWFETPLLKALLAAPSLTGTWLGPWSAGSVATLLFQECRAGSDIQGGPAALIDALEACCRSHGVELRTSAKVQRILVKQGQVQGVELESSETLPAPQVAASCDPCQAFLELLSPTQLPEKLATAMRHWRTRGTTAKVHLALNGPLEFAGRPEEPLEKAHLADTLDDLERAFDAVKYRSTSKRPYLDVWVPSISAPSLAPEGHHVVSVLVSFAHHDLEGGWGEKQRQALGQQVLARLSEVAPTLQDHLVACEVITPQDLAERFHLTGGHIHHGEHSLDQLLSLRPTALCCRYSTPVAGLTLCGSGCHPGGGITCTPGFLAAQEMR